MQHITHDWEWIGFNALNAPLAFNNPLVIRLAVDIFAEHDWDQLHQLIAVMALTPQHHYQVITEQPGQMLEYMQALDLRQVIHSAAALDLFMPSAFYSLQILLGNIMLGTVIRDQQDANARIPLLRQTPAVGRMVHCQVGMEEIDLVSAPHAEFKKINLLTGETPYSAGGSASIDWVTISGDVGPDARPCHLGVVRSLVQQCEDAGVPCCLVRLGGNPVDQKEWATVNQQPLTIVGSTYLVNVTGDGSNPAEWPADLRVRQYPQAFQSKATTTASFSYALTVPDELRQALVVALGNYGLPPDDLLIRWLAALNAKTNHESIKLEAWLTTTFELLKQYPQAQWPAVMEVCERKFFEIEQPNP